MVKKGPRNEIKTPKTHDLILHFDRSRSKLEKRLQRNIFRKALDDFIFWWKILLMCNMKYIDR